MNHTASTRKESFQQLFPQEPSFRWKQITKALYDPTIQNWNDISTLSKDMRTALAASPFTSIKAEQVLSSKRHDTYKAMLTMHDGEQIETVLMQNRRDAWTICVSSQIGCAMRCGFCATGMMGFKRNLNKDEIIDQYRFWQKFLLDHPKLEQRISNIVFMGMGEPMANYENVKGSINELLENTELGNTKITVSTVGMIPQLEKLLEDDEWPHIRLAVSLHSAVRNTRQEIVPTSYDDFLPKLQNWSKRYLDKFGNNRHHLTFEYVMLKDTNDTNEHARVLANYVNRIGSIKVNLIPYNLTDNQYKRSEDNSIESFKDILEESGIIVTVRKTMGDDIEAACGQLVKLGSDS